jgi:hypothetical protein
MYFTGSGTPQRRIFIFHATSPQQLPTYRLSATITPHWALLETVMFKLSFIITGILTTLSACSGGSGYGPAPSSDRTFDPTDSEPAGATSYDPTQLKEPAAEPFSRPLENFVSNRVQWSDLKVSTLDARLTRGMNALSPSLVYAEIDVQVENQGSDIVDYQFRGTWDLRLADGTTKISSNSLGLLIGPGDAPSTTLAYVVDEATTLAGATLQLNCSDRNCEPFSIPLDQSVASDPLYQLTDLQEIKVQGGKVSYQVTRATLGRNDAIGGGRAATDTNLLRLDVIATVTESSSAYVTTDDILIVLDGNSYAPITHDNGVLKLGESQQMLVKHSVPETVTAFDLLFPGPADSRPRVSVNTANATLVPDSN